MANIPKGKKQVMITLPEDIIELVDKDAELNYIKRSQQISRIVIEYYKDKIENQKAD